MLHKETERSIIGTKATLVLLLLTSTFFALYRANSAYSSDEVWSIKAASLDLRPEIEVLKADVHPPLYFLILKPWIRLLGTEERAVRALSGLFYVLSVLGVYAIGRELYGQKTAVLCATIYLSSPLAILSAQFARMYALLSLISILSTYFYLQFSLKPRNSSLSTTLYVIVNVLGTFTHVAFFFVLLGQIAFHFLFFRKLRFKMFVGAIALTIIPYLLLWAPILLRQVTTSREGLAWIARPGISAIGELLLLYGGAFWLVAPALLYVWWRTGSESFNKFSYLSKRSLPLWLLAITILIPLSLSQVKPIFNSRLAIVGLHLFALLCGEVIGRRASYFAAIGLLALTLTGIFFLHPLSSRCDNRAIALYLNEIGNDGDIVIFTSLTRLPVDYYLERLPSHKAFFETSFPAEIDEHPGYEGRIDNPDRKALLEHEADELIHRIQNTESPSGKSRVFFFHGFRPAVDALLEQRLRKSFRLVEGQGVQCHEGSAYFKEVSVYR